MGQPPIGPVEVDFTDVMHAISPKFRPALHDTHRMLVLVGGAGSGKSWFTAQKFVLRCMNDSGIVHRVGVFRKVARTLRRSCFEQIRAVIASFGVSDLWDANLTDLSLTFKPNRSRFIFSGLDDPEKLKSIFGITSAWVEEATETTWGDLQEINRRIRGRFRAYKQIVLTLNPISAQHWIKRRICDAPDDDTAVIHSTFLDNPYLDEAYTRELRKMQTVDPDLWQVYGLGEWGMMQGIIYPHFILDEAEYSGEPDEVIYGLDFGFTNPTALLEIKLSGEDDAHVKEILYESGMTNQDLIAAMDNAGVSRIAPIYADSEDPARIEEIAAAGYNIFAADKGPGSVKAGIVLVRGMRIHTNPWNVGFNAEAQEYHWSRDRKGEIVDGVPVKTNDHAMDALRYALFTHCRERRERNMLAVYDLADDYTSPIPNL